MPLNQTFPEYLKPRRWGLGGYIKKPRQADNLRKYKMKQIPKIDILYSWYSRKNKKTTESVIFRLYSKDIGLTISLVWQCLGIKTKYHRLRRFLAFSWISGIQDVYLGTLTSLLIFQGFHTAMYASSWFLTLFSSVFPPNVSFRIMDMFICDVSIHSDTIEK